MSALASVSSGAPGALRRQGKGTSAGNISVTSAARVSDVFAANNHGGGARRGCGGAEALSCRRALVVTPRGRERDVRRRGQHTQQQQIVGPSRRGVSGGGSSRLGFNTPRVAVFADATAAAASGRMRVAISGASGFVGTRLVAKLLAGGHEVRVLTRDVNAARAALRLENLPSGTITFDDPSRWSAAIAGCTGVVNLAGEPISTRWSPAIKAEIMASRIKATKRITEAIEACPEDQRPSAVVNASAVGFYGTSETATFDETAPPGSDYLSKVCQAWESTAGEMESLGVRVVLLRLGIVLDRDGGALGKMLPTFQLFAGGPMGDGAQWFSWVHREDAVGIVMESLTNASMSGPVNVTAPNPVRMGEMCEALGRTLGRPSWLPVPDFAIQALLGEGATVVLQGQKVSPSAALNAGYKFKYERIDDALQNILR